MFYLIYLLIILKKFYIIKNGIYNKYIINLTLYYKKENKKIISIHFYLVVNSSKYYEDFVCIVQFLFHLIF